MAHAACSLWERIAKDNIDPEKQERLEKASVGEYNWGGAGGTFFWVDPKEQLIGVLMVQAPSQRVYLRSIFKKLVVQATVK